MSNTLIMAVVTAILKNLLENSLIQQAVTTGMGDVTVTALSPDRVVVGADERPQLNFYLYRLTPNSGWRRTGAAEGALAQQEPALALDLHYLLSAYGERDFQAEALLGAAISCLQESALLSDEDIGAALTPLASRGSGNETLKMLAQAARALPLKQICVTPEFLSLEDLSKLWSSLQARARLSVTYRVSLVLSATRSDEQTRLARAR